MKVFHPDRMTCYPAKLDYLCRIASTDIDECSGTHGMDFDELCHFCNNTEGGYNCTCKPGFATESEDLHKCKGKSDVAAAKDLAENDLITYAILRQQILMNALAPVAWILMNYAISATIMKEATIVPVSQGLQYTLKTYTNVKVNPK